jgi:hypothetical protein
LSQFSRDGVPEAGFGDAVTNSFYCDVADAFCLGDSIGYFFITSVYLSVVLPRNLLAFNCSVWLIRFQRTTECGLLAKLISILGENPAMAN